MGTSNYDLVALTLAGLGLPGPTNMTQAMLIKDGYFVGWKFRYDGGHAIARDGSDTIEFYGERGTPLKTVTLGDANGGGGVEKLRSPDDERGLLQVTARSRLHQRYNDTYRPTGHLLGRR